jgi:hypothetical protein
MYPSTATPPSGVATGTDAPAGRNARHRPRRWQLGRQAMLTAGLAAGVYGLLIRPWHLRWGATDAEVARPMPGDHLVEHPQLCATRAITIDAPPHDVWPWLVQMGAYTRAGWYSYDRVDNAGRTSAWDIRPELQHLDVGDILPTDPDGNGFEVRGIDPGRSLVLGIDEPRKAAISTAITLEGADEDRTRLIIRLRQRAPTWRGWPFLAAMDVGDFLFMRRMLLGIRDRAERRAEPLPPPPVTRQP